MVSKTKNSFFLVLVLFSSCNNSGNTCEKISIPKKDLNWMGKYKRGDKILFRSDMENVDTLELIEKNIEYNPCNKFELGPNQYQTFYYTFLSQRLNDHKSAATAGLTYSTGSSMYGANKKVVYAFGMCWVSADLENDNLVAKQKIKLNGIQDSILTMYFEKSNYTSGKRPVIKSFNWHEELGLVQYKTLENGETYKYWKKI